jgi:hypothetical protein
LVKSIVPRRKYSYLIKSIVSRRKYIWKCRCRYKWKRVNSSRIESFSKTKAKDQPILLTWQTCIFMRQGSSYFTHAW